jgi:hypothetical protein
MKGGEPEEKWMQTVGRHGPHEGMGLITTERNGRTVSLEYRYHSTSEGRFHGSISLWDPTDEEMGLTAYLSREMPTRQAMLEWIFQKAEKLTGE